MAFNMAAILKFSSKGLKDGLSKANKQYGKLNNNMKKVGARVKATGPGLRNVGIAGTAMAGGVGYAVNSFMKFQKQMDSVKAKMKPTQEEYKKMSNLAKEMGSSTIYTAQQAAEGLEYLALAGFKAKDAMAVLPTVLYTAGAGAMELGKASDIITDSMSAMTPVMTKYGSKVNQATALSDMLAVAQASTNTNIEQLGEAIKYGGGAMSNMGIPLKEIIGSMGALADSGLKGSGAGTSLVNMMGKLSKPSSKATKMMTDMGISMDMISHQSGPMKGKMKSMSTVMSVFAEAIKKNPDMLKKNAVSMEIFGKRGAKAFFALQNKGVKNLDKLFDKLKDSKGASKEMYDTMTDNLYGSWESMKSAVSGSVLNLGQLFTSMFDLKGVIQAVTTPISKFALAMSAAMIPMSDWSDMQTELMQSGIGQFVLGLVTGFESVRLALIGVWESITGTSTAVEEGVDWQLMGERVTKVASALVTVGPPILAIGAAIMLLGPIITAGVSGLLLMSQMGLLTGTTLATVGSAIAWLGKTTKISVIATKAWTAVQWLLNAAMTANPIGAIVVGVTALITASILVYKYWDNIVDGFKSAVMWVLKLIPGVNAVIGAFSWFKGGKKKVEVELSAPQKDFRKSMGMDVNERDEFGMIAPNKNTDPLAGLTNDAQLDKTKANAKSHKPDTPLMMQLEPNVTVNIENTLDENGMKSAVDGATRHQNNKEGSAVSSLTSNLCKG